MIADAAGRAVLAARDEAKDNAKPSVKRAAGSPVDGAKDREWVETFMRSLRRQGYVVVER